MEPSSNENPERVHRAGTYRTESRFERNGNGSVRDVAPRHLAATIEFDPDDTASQEASHRRADRTSVAYHEELDAPPAEADLPRGGGVPGMLLSAVLCVAAAFPFVSRAGKGGVAAAAACGFAAALVSLVVLRIVDRLGPGRPRGQQQIDGVMDSSQLGASVSEQDVRAARWARRRKLFVPPVIALVATLAVAAAFVLATHGEGVGAHDLLDAIRSRLGL